MDALKIKDRDSLQHWLEDKPVEWAQLIALRAALRVFPLVLEGLDRADEAVRLGLERLTLAVWRCLIISSVARKHPTDEMRAVAVRAAVVTAVGAVRAADTAAATAAVRAADAAAAAVRAADAATTIAVAAAPDAAAAAAAAADAVSAATSGASYTGEHQAWNAVIWDASWLETKAEERDQQPLWLEDVRSDENYRANFPLWAREPFDAFAISELARTTAWGLIVEWYRALLPNDVNARPRSLFDENTEKLIATQPDEFWNREEPQDVMDDIAAIAGRRKTGLKLPDLDRTRFSIIRVGREGYWDGKTIFTYDRSRFLETAYTSVFYREEFSELDAVAIEKLKRLPVLFTYEVGRESQSKVGRFTDIRLSHRGMELRAEFDASFREILPDELEDLWVKLGVSLDDFEMNRTQWSIKEGDLYGILSDFRLAKHSSNNSGKEDNPETPRTIAPPRAETAYVGDKVDGSVDYLQRSEIAFALAGQLNDVWDSMNPEPKRFVPFDSAWWTGRFKRDPREALEPGFVVHVDAPWGGGKTTFAEYLTQILNPYRLPHLPQWLKDLPLGDAEKWKKSHRRPWHVVQFNAWQHEHVSPPWWVFYETIRKAATDAAVNETNQRWDDPPPKENEDAKNRPADPLPDFGYDDHPFMACLRRFEFWVSETFWRLVTPKVLTSLSVTVATAFALWFLVWSGTFSLNFTDPAKSSISGKDLPGAMAALLVVLFGGGATIRTIVSSFAQSLTPGTPDAAKNYSMGAGDPLRRMRGHFLRLTKRLNRPIIVIVDDLDRCNARFVTELVRGMQTILVSPRVVYVLLGDRDWIEQAFAEVNKEMKAIDVGAEHSFGGRFVEKAIQLSMVLPAMTEDVREGYVEFLLSGNRETEAAKTIHNGSGSEPEIPSPMIRNGLEMALQAASLAAPAFLGGAGATTVAAITQQIVIALATKKFAEREAATQKVLENIRSDNFGNLSEEIRRGVGRELDFLAVGDEDAEAETRHLLLALAPALPPNPRQIKRILNTLTLNQQVMTKIYPEYRAGSTQWQQLARWVVMAVEWPMSWFTLTRHPELADVVLKMSAEKPGMKVVEQTSRKVDGTLSQEQATALAKKLADTRPVVELLTFSNQENDWPDAPLTTEAIEWLRQIMPATSGRVLEVAVESPVQKQTKP